MYEYEYIDDDRTAVPLTVPIEVERVERETLQRQRYSKVQVQSKKKKAGNRKQKKQKSTNQRSRNITANIHASTHQDSTSVVYECTGAGVQQFVTLFLCTVVPSAS